MKIKGLSFCVKEEKEKIEIVLSNYEKMLSSLKGKVNEEEAICLANIIKINYKLIGDCNTKNNLEFGKRCEFIVKNKNLDKNSEWYKEFKEIYRSLEEDNKTLVLNMNRESIKTKFSTQFDEIDDKFNKKNSNFEFIFFILTKRPYPKYKEDKDKKVVDFTKESPELYQLLIQRYHPNEFTIKEDDENSLLEYYLAEHIEAKLNKLSEEIN